MPKLTDTQLVILSAAAQREDGAVLPVPKSLKIKGAAVTRTFEGLRKKGLLEEMPAARDSEAWRKTDGGQRMMLVITESGLRVIDGGPDGEADKKPAAKKRQAKKPCGRAASKPAAQSIGKQSAPAVRQGTKQALLIDLLKHKNGATLDEAVAAMGWQPHSVRGAISGALKKKLGLSVESKVVEKRGRVYRIVGRG